MRGLIIKDRWSTLILNGSKIYELRSRKNTIINEKIYVLNPKDVHYKCVGEVEFNDNVLIFDETYTTEEKLNGLINTFEYHRVPNDFYADLISKKRLYGWKISKCIKYPCCFKYKYQKGCQTWIKNVQFEQQLN